MCEEIENMKETKVQRHTQHWICLLLLKFNKHQSSLIFLFVILHCVSAPDYYIGPLYTLCCHCIRFVEKICVFFFFGIYCFLCVSVCSMAPVLIVLCRLFALYRLIPSLRVLICLFSLFSALRFRFICYVSKILCVSLICTILTYNPNVHIVSIFKKKKKEMLIFHLYNWYINLVI